MIWRACVMGGEFDSRLFLAIHGEMTFSQLLDVIEIQDCAADWRAAASEWVRKEGQHGE